MQSCGDRVALLISRLDRLTRQRGRKALVARELGVSRQTINKWFVGSAHPNAETTLQLLEWVTAEEAKQKSVSSVLAPPTPKTRLRKPREKKPKPGRRKK
jgi:DNA-binding phage protein